MATQATPVRTHLGDTLTIGNCATEFSGGGFWYGDHCGGFFPNGRYYNRTNPVPRATGLHWWNWRGSHYSLKAVSMMYRATN